MFLKYGAVRGIWLSRMSERERRDVPLKGARDLARAKLDQVRATEPEAQAKSLKPAGSELPPAVQETASRTFELVQRQVGGPKHRGT